MRTLGMIGGTSWHSTIEYYRLINQMAAENLGHHANPPLIIHSINIELMREQNKDKINKKYLEISQKLQRAGAEAILICANTPHMVYDYVQPQIDIPILHIAGATGRDAQKKGLKTLGLLGNRPTMTGDFIPKILKRNYDINTIIPEQHCLGQAHHYVSKELTQGVFSDKARNFFKIQIDLLRNRGAEGIILGCTELPLLIDPKEIDIPTLATTNLHARMGVEFIFG